MLTARKDAGTGNKLTLYWTVNGRREPVPQNKRDEYWAKEVKRLKAALDYEVAKREALAVELEKEVRTNRSILKLADAMINCARDKI